MKNKIIKNSLFILLASVLTLPLTSKKVLADSGIHLPTLESFNWPIVSLYGPRNPYPVIGTKFHVGIDFSPLLGNADLGYMIKSRTDGEILNFIKGSSGGWRLVVWPGPDIEKLHGAGDFFYMHLFQNNGTVPGIKNSAEGYTKVEVVDVAKSPSLKCKGIAFWKNTTLAKVLTKKQCDGGIYGIHIDVPATSKVKGFDEIAPMGNSHSSTIQAHLHFGMNLGDGKNGDNPFYALKRTDISPGEPFFSAKFWKDPSDSSKLLSNSGFWVDIISGTEYSLDKVDLMLVKQNGEVESKQFSFGGRPGESKTNLEDRQIFQIPADPKCEKSPTGSYSQPITQACIWDGEPSPRKWRFFVPYDIKSLPGGTHQLCTKMTSINGYSNTEVSCETIVVEGCSIPAKIGDKCGGGIVFYVDEAGQHGLIAALADQSSSVPWYNGIYKVTGATGDGVGAGAANTATIVAAQINDSPPGWSFAAKVADDFRIRGDGLTACYGSVGEICHNDWYLPSKFELHLLHQQIHVVGGFAGFYHWSSTEIDSFYAWSQLFDYGLQVGYHKNASLRVRAVRAF